MKHTSLILCLAASLFWSCQKEGVVFEGALCIEHIAVIDPIEGFLEDQTVVIKGGKILTVEASATLNLAAANEILNGNGKFIMPGLWDAHVHFAYIEDLAPRMLDLFLAYGITSVRDTGGDIGFVKQWKDKATADPTAAPRVMIAGPLLDGLPNVYDGSDPSKPPLSVGLGSAEAIIAQVNHLDSMGVNLLKAYEMLTPEQFELILQLAKEKNLKVTGHVPLSMDVISASDAGLHSMEHLRNIELSCASNAAELLEQRRRILALGKNDKGGILRSRIHQTQRQEAIANFDTTMLQEVLQALHRNETWQIPTLALNVAFMEMPFADPEWQKSFAYLPDSIAQRWKENIEAFQEREASDFDVQYTAWKKRMVAEIHATGIDMMAGTDCPIFFLTPGRSLHEELAVLVDAGLSPLDAIKTATLNPARYFGLEDELGTIKQGQWADLLILDANPLLDINNTQKINAVVRQGKLYTREDLDRILRRLREG